MRTNSACSRQFGSLPRSSEFLFSPSQSPPRRKTTRIRRFRDALQASQSYGTGPKLSYAFIALTLCLIGSTHLLLANEGGTAPPSLELAAAPTAAGLPHVSDVTLAGQIGRRSSGSRPRTQEDPELACTDCDCAGTGNVHEFKGFGLCCTLEETDSAYVMRSYLNAVASRLAQVFGARGTGPSGSDNCLKMCTTAGHKSTILSTSRVSFFETATYEVSHNAPLPPEWSVHCDARQGCDRASGFDWVAVAPRLSLRIVKGHEENRPRDPDPRESDMYDRVFNRALRCALRDPTFQEDLRERGYICVPATAGWGGDITVIRRSPQ